LTAKNDPLSSSGRTIDVAKERLLIEALRRDDREALAAIYDAYASYAYGLALHTVRQAAEAEDVVQESFLALWRQAARLDPERGIKSYLLTIVHNKAVDKLRQSGRRGESPLNLDAPIASEGGETESTAMQLVEQEVVRDALTQLPAEQRRTVELAYYAGFTLAEVASSMQVPLGTVKSRLRLALGQLRRRLATE
jgi:RNA polymerase sigma-70 factor (ECF subfamily)